MTSPTNSAYVFSTEAVRRAVSGLVAIRTHEHLAGYLAILYEMRATGAANVLPSAIKDFHDRFLFVPGDAGFPYVSPFRSGGAAELKRINKNVAGSYAPSSLRANRPFPALVTIDGQGTAATYSLRADHASTASVRLLNGNKLPALALSIFLFRDYGFDLEKKELSSVLEIFREQFGLREDSPAENEIFSLLFNDDTSGFSNDDLMALSDA